MIVVDLVVSVSNIFTLTLVTFSLFAYLLNTKNANNLLKYNNRLVVMNKLLKSVSKIHTQMQVLTIFVWDSKVWKFITAKDQNLLSNIFLLQWWCRCFWKKDAALMSFPFWVTFIKTTTIWFTGYISIQSRGNVQLPGDWISLRRLWSNKARPFYITKKLLPIRFLAEGQTFRMPFETRHHFMARKFSSIIIPDILVIWMV